MIINPFYIPGYTIGTTPNLAETFAYFYLIEIGIELHF